MSAAGIPTSDDNVRRSCNTDGSLAEDSNAGQPPHNPVARLLRLATLQAGA
jgi:hypothetical protein